MRALLPDFVEDFAVELSLLPQALHLRHLDHTPQQVEGQVDGQRRLFAPFQQLRRRPHCLLLALLFWREQAQRIRVPSLEKPQDVLAQELRGGAVPGGRRSEEHLVQLLRLEAAAAIQPAGKDARSAGGGAEVRREEDRGEEQEQGDWLHVLQTEVFIIKH